MDGKDVKKPPPKPERPLPPDYIEKGGPKPGEQR